MSTAKLYIVPTPIGNLKDITLRALETLAQVDFIVCEDTRHTRKLLNHYQIKKPMIAAEKFSEARKSQTILKHLEQGALVALVSDAGTPLISDPGALVVSQVRQAGFDIEALPGACAFVTALSASGFSGNIRFIGFFPRHKKQGELERMRMQLSTEVTVFYESPRRLRATLSALLPGLEDRGVCIAREITKIHEEYRCGLLSEVLQNLPAKPLKGEITVLIQGLFAPVAANPDTADITQRARTLLKQGYSRRDILQTLTQETGMARNRLYRLLLNLV
jgi:16S rRNA (cytidine1402-2'-O)-methyltransferase